MFSSAFIVATAIIFISVITDLSVAINSQEIFKYAKLKGYHPLDIFSRNVMHGKTLCKYFHLESIPCQGHELSSSDLQGRYLVNVLAIVENLDDVVKALAIISKRLGSKSRTILLRNDVNIDLVLNNTLNGSMTEYKILQAKGKDQMQVFKVINLPRFTKPVINELDINKKHQVIDLQGQLLTDTSKALEPFISSRCPQRTKYIPFHDDNNCMIGHMVDMQEEMCKILNCSTKYTLHDKWGLYPVTGTFENGTFDGVLGDVMYNNYDFGLSTWWWLLWRDKYLDFVPVHSSPYILALTPHAPSVDYNLFFRPFTTEAWTRLLLLILIIILFVSTLKKRAKKLYSFHNVQLTVETAGWMLFTVLYAYYSGGMTMFFATDFSLPFNTIQEVMREYPTWRLLMRHGYDVMYQVRADKGDIDFQIFMQRLTLDRESNSFINAEDGLRKIKESQSVMHIGYSALKSVYIKYPYLQQKIVTFGFENNLVWGHIILPKHSPLTQIFYEAFQQLKEGGVMHKLEQKWFGSSLPKYLESEKRVLKIGQAVVGFAWMVLAFMTVIVLLCAEVVHKNWSMITSKFERILDGFLQLFNSK